MKPIYLALLFLALILIGGTLNLHFINNQTRTLSEQLDSLEKSINHENWLEASASLKKFKNIWQRINHRWAMIIDHNELDYINMGLGELEAYIETKSKSNALAKLKNLQILVEHIPEKERPSLQNIL